MVLELRLKGQGRGYIKPQRTPSNPDTSPSLTTMNTPDLARDLARGTLGLLPSLTLFIHPRTTFPNPSLAPPNPQARIT